MGNTGTAVSKVVARLASVGLDEASNNFLHDCFKQFGIHVAPISGAFSEVLGRRKFEACVLRLYAPDAEEILTAARNSPSNRRMVIYGLARNSREALQFSSFGINAIFDEPLERQGVLRVVRATHLLVHHELRRYVRIPVVSEVIIDIAGSKSLTVASQEVSGGGMSVLSASAIPSQGTLQVKLTLPGINEIKVRASLCWSRPQEHLYGLRFDSNDDARFEVRKWIDRYLELV